MRWPRNYMGKYVHNMTEAIGICDYSSFPFNHRDLVKQMDWRGDRLVWTGRMVGVPFLDVPNEQLRPPKVEADPYPVINPRFPANFLPPDAVPALPANEQIALMNKFNWSTGEYEQ